MHLELQDYLIVCPFIFLAGLIDAIGGGGGLISLPAYLIAGLPTHSAIATNKLSSTCGTALATYRFFKNGLIHLKLAVPAILAAMVGSSIGSNLSMWIDEKILEYLLLLILPLTTFIVLNKKLLHDNENDTIILNRKTYMTAVLSALIIGMYDGLYGPGTGTFLIICFTMFNGMSMKMANAQAKVINLTTNITSLAVFLLHGQVLLPLGIAAAVFNMAGSYIGSSLVLKNGGKIVKPSILIVLFLLGLKIIGVFG